MSHFTQLQSRLQTEPQTWLVTVLAGFIGPKLFKARPKPNHTSARP